MTTIQTLSEAIRNAWADVPAPPVEDLKYMARAWGEAAAREFIGVAPMDVDRDSSGFSTTESLLDLPPRAGAAYLGSFLLSALEVLELQKSGRELGNITYRAKIVFYLDLAVLWEHLWPFLSPKCREVWVQVALYIASEHESFGFLTPENVTTIRALADKFSKTE
jgi:hypothetical protein